MKGFFKFLATVAVSVCLTIAITMYMLRNGQAELRIKRLDVVSGDPSCWVSIDESVCVSCRDGGVIVISPGPESDDPISKHLNMPASGAIRLEDKTRRHGVVISIRDTLPSVELWHDGKMQPRHSLQADGF